MFVLLLEGDHNAEHLITLGLNLQHNRQGLFIIGALQTHRNFTGLAWAVEVSITGLAHLQFFRAWLEGKHQLLLSLRILVHYKIYVLGLVVAVESDA